MFDSLLSHDDHVQESFSWDILLFWRFNWFCGIDLKSAKEASWMECWSSSEVDNVSFFSIKFLIFAKFFEFFWNFSNFLSFVTIGGLIVNCYDLYDTNFSSPMRFLIPGLSRSSIFFFPANIIFQVTLYFAILHVIMGSDAVIMITICYFRSENQAVVEFIEQLDESEIVQKNCNGIFRNIYEVHHTVTWNMKKLLEGYWHIYFYKLFTIILYLCALLFIFQSVNISMMIVILCALIVTAQIFILCFFGQLLRNSSEVIAEALYMTKWYEMGIEDQKNLLLLLLRFQKAVKIEAFGFGTISIYTFVQVNSTLNNSNPFL